MLIEYIATTIEDVITIEQSGADRIELVSALSEGGLTPSYGLIEMAVKSVQIPINVMVRPHAQSFCYSDKEIEIMKKDIQMIRSLGANGVVFGVLNQKSEICFQQLENLLTEIGSMEVTFHRAIDSAHNLLQSAEKLDTYKEITTILTSGGYGDWKTRIETLKAMKERCKQTNLLIGSGLTKGNILDVHRQVHTNCYHFGTAVREDQSVLKNVSLKKAVEIISILK